MTGTTASPGDGDRPEQHNTGPGTFVNGHVSGGIHHHYQQLSKETLEHLEIIAETSPKLAELLAGIAAGSARDVGAAELIATTARRFNLADSAEQLAKAADTFKRMSLPDCADSLAAASQSLASVLPKLLTAVDALNARGRRGL